MLAFQPIDLSQRERALKYLCAEQYGPTEGSFAALYIWGGLFHTQICFCDDFLFIRSGAPGREYYQFPRGEGDLAFAMDLIYQDAVSRGSVPRLQSVTDKMCEQLENVLPGRFSFVENRDSFDYIYNASDLIELPGKRFHQKRNHVNRFKKELEGRYLYQKMTPEVIPEVYSFQKRWLAENSTPENQNALAQEMHVIERALLHFEALELIGGLIRVDGEIAAYTFGSHLCCDSFLVSIEKADIRYPGIYQAINQFFVENNCRDVRYINREDDAGSPGLRKAKLSYHPEILLRKFQVFWKESQENQREEA